jgi:hypothetical protein
METSPEPQQISVSGRIVIEGRLPTPSSAGSNSAPAQPAPPYWKFWKWPSERVLAGATAVLALATLVLAGMAGIQAWILATTDASTRKAAEAAVRAAAAAETALKTARENFRSERRPIIWLTNQAEPPHFLKTGDNTVRVAWTWHFTNYGKTPALKISYSEFMSIEGKVAPNFTSTGPAAPVPTNKDDLSTIVSSLEMTHEQFDKLMKIDNAIGISVLITLITYNDAYDEEYETDFCLNHLASGLSMYCRRQRHKNKGRAFSIVPTVDTPVPLLGRQPGPGAKREPRD